MNLKTEIPVGRLWNKQIVLREFLNSPLKKVALCKSYGGEKWKKYYNDITKWSLTDPEFREAYESYMKKNDPDRDTKNLGGRPPVEAPEDWKEQFCLDLIKYNGNKSLASRNSPYSFKTILQKLNPDYQLADKELIEMVKTTELEIAARIEAVIVAAMIELEDPQCDLETAKIADIRVRAGEKVLSKLDVKRWGKRADLIVTGTMTHKHLAFPTRVNNVERLLTEQREMMGIKGVNKPLALPEHMEEIMEAEVIDGDL